MVGLFFAVYLLTGLGVSGNYGVAWDEGAWRALGIATARYVVDGNPELLTNQDRYNGPVFQVALVALEHLLGLTKDSRSIFLMRHRVNFLFFFLGVVFFYRMCRRHFASRTMGLLGAFFLVLSPRIFAQSFYNSSDIILLVMFVISVYTLISYLRSPSVRMAILHAVACAFTVNIRTMGFMIPFFTVIFLIAGHFISSGSYKSRPLFLSLSVYLALFSFLFFLLWPTIWSNPVVQLQEAFRYMREVPWYNLVLYLGHYVRDTVLPWHYVLVWMMITLPLFYVVGFLLGSIALLSSFLKISKRSWKVDREDMIFFLWFFLPLCGVLVLRPGLYDGWRHLFFVYPAFLMIALKGIEAIYRLPFPYVKPILIIAIFFHLLHTAWTMVGLHPYENVYFNRLAGRDMKEVKERFELDYWGLSYRAALEHILANDSGESIKIHVANQPGKENAKILTAKDRNRLVFVEDPAEAKYFLSNYRWHKEDYPYEDEFYSIKIGNAKIMVVYRL